MANDADVRKAYEIDSTRVKYLNDLDLERSASERLKTQEGIDVDFEKPHLVRDQMEQTAAALTCATPEQKKAVSDFLASIQKPDITAEQLKKATRELTNGDAFGEMDARHLGDNGRLLNGLDHMANGMLVHETIVADRQKLADLVSGNDASPAIGRGLPPAAPPKL